MGKKGFFVSHIVKMAGQFPRYFSKKTHIVLPVTVGSMSPWNSASEFVLTNSRPDEEFSKFKVFCVEINTQNLVQLGFAFRNINI